jgi:hypothetical protein
LILRSLSRYTRCDSRYIVERRAHTEAWKKLVAKIEKEVGGNSGERSPVSRGGRGQQSGNRRVARGTGVDPKTIRNDNKLKKLAQDYPCTAPN